MGNLYTGLLWLMNASTKQESELEHAAEYAEAKCGRPVRLIACPVGETYPAAFRDIPIRPDKRIMAQHIYLVNEARERTDRRDIEGDAAARE